MIFDEYPHEPPQVLIKVVHSCSTIYFSKTERVIIPCQFFWYHSENRADSGDISEQQMASRQG
jgi:hypothetical protein